MVEGRAFDEEGKKQEIFAPSSSVHDFKAYCPVGASLMVSKIRS